MHVVGRGEDRVVTTITLNLFNFIENYFFLLLLTISRIFIVFSCILYLILECDWVWLCVCVRDYVCMSAVIYQSWFFSLHFSNIIYSCFFIFLFFVISYLLYRLLLLLLLFVLLFNMLFVAFGRNSNMPCSLSFLVYLFVLT